MSEKSKKTLHVFLCHASNDKEKIRVLYNELVQRGIDVWLDEESLLAGQDWQSEIPQAVHSSDAIIVCLSKNAITKEGYIQKEIRYALDVAKEKPEGTIFLIPIKLEECIVPRQLNHLQWINLYYTLGSFDEKDFKRLIRSLNARAVSIGADSPKEAPIRRKLDTDNMVYHTTRQSQLDMAFNSYNLPVGNFLRELLVTDENATKASDLIKWCIYRIVSDQFTEGDAAGAWSKRNPDFLQFVYEDQGTPNDLSYYESISLSRIIATTLERYRRVSSNDGFSNFVLPRFALLRDYLIRHYNAKFGGFGLSTRRKLRRPATIDVDLRHTIQAVMALWELGNLDEKTEEMLRHAGAYIKKEVNALDLKEERVLTFSVVHSFLISDASTILIIPDTVRRALLKRLESAIVERFDNVAHSWDLDRDPIEKSRIDNALLLLSDMPIKSCIDEDCANVLQSAIRHLLENDLIRTDEQVLALPFYDTGESDIGVTLQLVKTILENREVITDYINFVKPMLNFSLAPENRTRIQRFAYPWYLVSILEIAIMP